MTLQSLYNSIDWSQIDSKHDEKAEEYVKSLGVDTKKVGNVLNLPFVERFRMVLLREGLENPEKKIMMEARKLLTPVIWDQVVGFYDA